ncbi:MAG: flagellar biosynthesis protein FlhF [Epsilonproteobacteria bacterium 4484_65]|nr:MAG: flagellar biosynthesis protein FlhF [Epsilonproteobacteria bacterium 4484_65]
MIRKAFKKKSSGSKLDKFIEKYNLPREYLSINRKSVSRGVLIGLFWGFIPMPMQMLGVMATTPFLRFNPFTMPPMYYMEYLTGNLILGREGLSDIEITMDWFSENWDNIIIPLYTGTAFYSIVVSSLIYFLINRLWIASVRKEKSEKEKKRKKLKNKLFTFEPSHTHSIQEDESKSDEK